MHQPIEPFARALDALSLELVSSVEINEVYISAGKKGHERGWQSSSHGLSTRGRGS